MNIMWRSCESLGLTQVALAWAESRDDFLNNTSIADSRCQLQVMQHNAILIYGWSMSVNIKAEK